MRKQINEVAPLVAALMGALVGMGLEKNKAKKAAQQAVDKSQGGSTWQDPDAVSSTKPKTKRTGVLQNGKIIRQGNQVKRLQQLLYGKTEGPQIDGKFGPNTEKALKTFQKNQGLKVDGIAGKNTIRLLNKMQASGDSGAGDQAMARRNAALDRVTGTRIDPGTTTGGPSRLKQRLAAQTGEGTNMSNTKQINEEITISGSADDLIRMMQLAGASGAKAVDIDDINQAPDTPCGASKPEPDMGDMIRMMSPEEAIEEGGMKDAVTDMQDRLHDFAQEIQKGMHSYDNVVDELNDMFDEVKDMGDPIGTNAFKVLRTLEPEDFGEGEGGGPNRASMVAQDAMDMIDGSDDSDYPHLPNLEGYEAVAEEDGPMGDEYDDEPSAPDEEYANDVSASIPHGDDLHKKKRSYPKAAGGDNPMALEAEIRAKLEAALEEKKKSPAGGPACWDGKKIHPTKPTKMKGGKRVNNCIDADSSDGK